MQSIYLKQRPKASNIFFGDYRDFYRNYYRHILKKRFKWQMGRNVFGEQTFCSMIFENVHLISNRKFIAVKSRRLWFNRVKAVFIKLNGQQYVSLGMVGDVKNIEKNGNPGQPVSAPYYSHSPMIPPSANDWVIINRIKKEMKLK